LLTLLAFYFHQIIELRDPAYQLCQRTCVAKKELLQEFRVLICHFVFTGWHDVMFKAMTGRREIGRSGFFNKLTIKQSWFISN
jgi:hypothetical protein